MKRISLVLAFLLAAFVSAAAQTQVRERRSTERVAPPAGEQPAGRNRLVGPTKSANHTVKDTAVVSPPASNSAPKQEGPKPAWGDASVPKSTSPTVQLKQPTRPVTTAPNYQNTNSGQPKLVKQTTLTVDNSAALIPRITSPPTPPAVTSVYRVGVGDVLDIRLANMATRESTLFTVLKNGEVEYPLLSRPVTVSGMTTDEIARRLSSEIKVIQGARALVSVRDYASHAVVVTGVVDNPGRKVLRREAMPLFTILAEALPRSEATGATIVRKGSEINLSLSNSQDLSTLVMSGDTIKILAAPKRFVYLGGDITSVGEKEFRDGMTLTQALLTGGGVSRDAKHKVKIGRRGANGLLISEEHNLKAIDDGKAPDPLLQPGDRIEVQRGVW